ncbi:hypothetical protein [Rhizobium sp. SGZ-381]|uniref:hypothetical protein n=1 Tax=Rhizobium sp. SGZ-381 TaxID=3342800 RepID=UPI00366EFEDF
MAIRYSTARYIEQVAAREGGMTAFEEYYTTDFDAGLDRVAAMHIEGGRDWRNRVRRQLVMRGGVSLFWQGRPAAGGQA